MRGISAFLALLGIGVLGITHAVAAPAPHKMALINIELEGDLSDVARQSEWPYRLASLERHLREGITESGTYEIVSLDSAEEWFHKNKGRKALYNCPPCLKDIAGQVGDRHRNYQSYIQGRSRSDRDRP